MFFRSATLRPALAIRPGSSSGSSLPNGASVLVLDLQIPSVSDRAVNVCSVSPRGARVALAKVAGLPRALAADQEPDFGTFDR
jgi:hypothetical protein